MHFEVLQVIVFLGIFHKVNNTFAHSFSGDFYVYRAYLSRLRQNATGYRKLKAWIMCLPPADMLVYPMTKTTLILTGISPL